MSQIKVEHLTFSYEGVYENIFENVNFTLDTDWKLGFIGRNGRGKTTFLQLLRGKFEYQGKITANVTFDYFPFDINDIKRNTLAICKEIIAPYADWETGMEQCLNDGSEASLERYGDLQEIYMAHDGYIIDELIEKELNQLNIEPDVLQRPFKTLSFGERNKVMLASMFLKKNNFLLIDEPTNHLDTESRQNLADYLKSKKGFILVSHDRNFLDTSVDHVLSINKAGIEVQKGNYSSWKKSRDLQDQYELNQNEALKKDINRLSAAKQRTSNWSDKVESGKIGQGPSDRGYIGHMAAKMMKRSKTIEQRQDNAIEEKKHLLKNIEMRSNLKMNILDYPKNRILELQDVTFGFEETPILKNISFSINKGERAAVCGRNGSGKSTLIKLILGSYQPDKGVINKPKDLIISYVNQDTSWLEGRLAEFAQSNQINETLFLTILRQFGLSRTQFEKKIEDFSGGQKKKVLLAASIAKPAHLWIWDEPLNFIDIISRGEIEDLILKYCPTMIFVEHDQVFMEKTATKIIQL